MLLLIHHVLFRQSSVRRIFRMTSTLYEFLSNPNALREVVFGADELTANVDVIDAAGFSSAVTGLLHYDVLRDDPRMTRILDQMYGKFGITRLTEGGLVNNVPVKPIVERSDARTNQTKKSFCACLRLFFTTINQYVVSGSKDGCSQRSRQYTACRSILSIASSTCPNQCCAHGRAGDDGNGLDICRNATT